jgi:hypothetical protein
VRRVPVVVPGTGPLAERFRALVEEVRVDLAGFEGFMLELANDTGPEPSVVVDTGGAHAALTAAVYAGHAGASADLRALTDDPVTFAVLRSDRRLGLRAALLPGLPLVEVLARCVDAADRVIRVELTGPDRDVLADEAVAVAALLGVELRRESVRVTGDAGPWRAVVGAGFPTVTPDDEPTRTARVVSARTDVTLAGDVGGDQATADALLVDVLAFAREADAPWRAHRRKTYAR